jgi:hypothetical protein
MPPTEYSPSVRLEICNGRSALASRTALHAPNPVIRWGASIRSRLALPEPAAEENSTRDVSVEHHGAPQAARIHRRAATRLAGGDTRADRRRRHRRARRRDRAATGQHCGGGLRKSSADHRCRRRVVSPVPCDGGVATSRFGGSSSGNGIGHRGVRTFLSTGKSLVRRNLCCRTQGAEKRRRPGADFRVHSVNTRRDCGDRDTGTALEPSFGRVLGIGAQYGRPTRGHQTVATNLLSPIRR